MNYPYMKISDVKQSYRAPQCDVAFFVEAGDCLLNISEFGIGSWTEGNDDWFSND